MSVFFNVTHRRNVTSALLLECLLGVGTVLRLERDEWSMVFGLGVGLGLGLEMT